MGSKFLGFNEKFCPSDGMVDIQDLKSWGGNSVPVQVRPWAVFPFGTMP